MTSEGNGQATDLKEALPGWQPKFLYHFMFIG